MGCSLSARPCLFVCVLIRQVRVKRKILDLIVAMEQEKRDNKISPVQVTGMELTQVIKTSLRQLVDEGKIHAGNTISDYYVKSIDDGNV